jgi:hypothetical protein
LEETELRIQPQKLETSRFFRGEKQRMGFARHHTQKEVTAIHPPKREVDFAHFGY